MVYGAVQVPVQVRGCEFTRLQYLWSDKYTINCATSYTILENTKDVASVFSLANDMSDFKLVLYIDPLACQ